MKRMSALAFGLALACLGGAARADFFDASLWGGYTTVNFNDVNQSADLLNQKYLGGGASVTHSTSGYLVGADASFGLLPFISVGPRVEYIAPGQLSMSYSGSLGNFKATEDFACVPVMLGARANFGIPFTGLSFNAGAYWGWAWATANEHFTISTSGNPPADFQVPATGNGQAAELAAGARYKLAPFTSLVLNLGYRFADIPSMTVGATPSNPYFTIASGAVQNINGATVPFDFGGFQVSGGLNLGF